ncbi:MAG: hypothetical protein OCU12_06250 [Methanophagales archaeon]|nr:hypothetical protein [Methanophagales archaeon]
MIAIWTAIIALALAAAVNYHTERDQSRHNRVLYLAENAEMRSKINLSIQLISLVALATIMLSSTA